MIEEDYVSFETAKLLKDKGFDGSVSVHYNELGSTIMCCNPISKNWIKCPTIQMAMKWLRDIHGLFIHIDIIREASCWTADIQDIKNDVAIYPVKEDFPCYEEACESAIKYCLENLI